VRHQLNGLVDRLADEYESVLPRKAIEDRARDKLNDFEDAKVVAFLPILVYRYVREDLQHSRMQSA
jgi:hypothetical protein